MEQESSVESMDVRCFGGCYHGRRVLLTGHTGFKGSWLALWLDLLGAKVTGISLDPDTRENHWDLLRLAAVDHRQDIRDFVKLRALVEAARPEIVFHLAAQPLVRRSYRDPIANWSTNVMGTAHVLEACRGIASLKAIVAVTTDKVYANGESGRAYRESDPLGGHDPYSASKAACEILIESYRKSYFDPDAGPLLASARGGNVVGGGDWSEDRLVPDAVRAIVGRHPLIIRAPQAIRPWQHVMDCLAGYLALGRQLFDGQRDCAGAWNFGPEPEDSRTVAEVLALLKVSWPELEWQAQLGTGPHEAMLLCLDHSKAVAQLGWRPVWQIGQAMQATVDWYRRYYDDGTASSREQLVGYIDAAREAGATWAQA